MHVLVTGGAGFVGSSSVRHLVAAPDHEVRTPDALTCAGDTGTLEGVLDHPRYEFVEDRPGHHQRYSLDTATIESLGLEPEWSFGEGLDATVAHLLEDA